MREHRHHSGPTAVHAIAIAAATVAAVLMLAVGVGSAGASCTTTGVHFGGSGGDSRNVTESSGCSVFAIDPHTYTTYFGGWYLRSDGWHLGSPGFIQVHTNSDGVLRPSASVGDTEHAQECDGCTAPAQDEELVH